MMVSEKNAYKCIDWNPIQYEYLAKSVILTFGTNLKALSHIGLLSYLVIK